MSARDNMAAQDDPAAPGGTAAQDDPAAPGGTAPRHDPAAPAGMAQLDDRAASDSAAAREGAAAAGDGTASAGAGPGQAEAGAARARGLRGLSRSRKIIIAVSTCGFVVFALIIAIGSGGGSSQAASAQPAAKPFTLHALGHAGRVSLSQYAGRPVLVNFFASWCGPCQKETPLLARFYRANHGKVAIIGIDVNDSAANAMRFVRHAGASYPIGTDPTATTATTYRVVAIPQTFFLNAHHHIVKRVFGAVTLADLNAGLARG